MRTEQLIYLIEISRSKSMSVASEKLHMTPQALSIAIKHLEEELNVILLKRTNKGTTLTEKGWMLTKFAKEFLTKVDTFVKDIPDQNHLSLFSGTYNICSTYGGINTFLPKLIVHFLQEYPEMNLSVQSFPYHEAYRLVSEKIKTFAFFEQYEIAGEKQILLEDPVHFYPLFRYRLNCQVPINFPISKYDSMTLTQMLKYPFIELTSGEGTPPSILPMLKRFGIPPKIFSVENSTIVKNILQSGMGVSFNISMPFQNADRFHLKNVKNIPIQDDLEIFFGYITSDNIMLSEVDEAFLTYINEHLHQILTEDL